MSGDALQFVVHLLRMHTQLPGATVETMAATLCSSLAPSTLARYMDIVRNAEKLMGSSFAGWLPF